MDAIEIDFRPLIRAVIASSRLIVAVALLAATITGLFSALRPVSFTANAQVAIVDQASQVDLKSNVTDQPSQLVQTDPTRLQASLLTLAANGGLAQTVINTLGAKLSPSLRQTQALQSLVKMDAVGGSNVLQVHVTSGSEEQAKVIASAWSAEYVRLVNTALAKHSKSADLAPQLEQAEINYASKQQQWSNSTLPQDVMRLRRQTESLNAALNSLRAARLKTITDTLATQSKNEAALLGLNMTAALTGQTAPVEAARNGQIVKLTQLYTMTTRLTQLHDDVLALRDQVSKGSTSGTGLAYILLKAQLFAGSDVLPTNLQIQTLATDIPTLTDLDALVATTEAHLKSTQEQIVTLSAALRQGTAYSLPSVSDLNEMRQTFQDKLQGTNNKSNIPGLLTDLVVPEITSIINDPKVDELEATYQKLAGELGQKEQQLYVLTQQRDLAKANYTALSTRATELQVANANDDAVVRVVGQGAVSSISRGIVKNMGLAFLSGLLLTTLFVILRALLAMFVNAPNAGVTQRPLTE